MRELGLFFQETLKELQGFGVSKHDIVDLFTHTYGVDRLTIMVEPHRSVDEKKIIEATERLKNGEPLPYIIGTVPFFGCEIKVTPSVLIPRQETELLVAFILEETKKTSGLLVDLCTGSGCIGIALKKAHPPFDLILVDNSPEALAIAKENCKENGVEATCLLGNFLDPLQGQKIDLLVCNPPYITADEYENLDKSVKNFEPKSALVAPNNGLFFYEKLAHELPSLMDSGSELYLEIGYQQGISVPLLFSGSDWVGAKCHLDLASHPRFVSVLRR